ncbi:hypothetical protein Tco_0659599, partial [Tanacetum coccineum]
MREAEVRSADEDFWLKVTDINGIDYEE